MVVGYCGTPDFSSWFLEKIMTNRDTLPLTISFVLTQPDRPVGKKQRMTPSPVKLAAQRLTLPLFYHLQTISVDQWKQLDLCLVYAYGNIIPSEFLQLPKHGFWNIHPSLLPRYRGPSPVVYPLLLGDDETGATLIQMDEKIDHGPIIAQKKIAIDPFDKQDDLIVKLTDSAYQLFKQTIVQLIKTSHIATVQQDHQSATYTKLLKKNDGFIPLQTVKKGLRREPITFDQLPTIIKEYCRSNPSDDPGSEGYLRSWIGKNPMRIIYDLWKGLHPWPGLWTKVLINGNEKRLKITDIDISNLSSPIKKVRLEGKKETSFEQFNSAYHCF